MVSALQAAKTLDLYVIDVGGKASLFVSPTGETMLIDAGIPANVDRIVNACKAAGVKKSIIWWCRTTTATMWAAFLRWRRKCPS